MKLKLQLLAVSDAYADAVNLSRARISTIVLNRGATLDAIAADAADVTTQTFEKAMQWFSDNWPDDLEWPDDIARPESRLASSQDADASLAAPVLVAGAAVPEAAE